jgi:hypothetical protein
MQIRLITSYKPSLDTPEKKHLYSSQASRIVQNKPQPTSIFPCRESIVSALFLCSAASESAIIQLDSIDKLIFAFYRVRFGSGRGSIGSVHKSKGGKNEEAFLVFHSLRMSAGSSTCLSL